MWKAILKAIAVAAFRALMGKMSEEIRKLIAQAFRDQVKPYIAELRTKAAVTPNPWDDIGVEALAGLIDGIEIK